jgi:nucleoside phosphorylase
MTPTNRHPLVRLGQTAKAARSKALRAAITNQPPLPTINFASIGQKAPGLPPTPDQIPAADAVVICWAESEWAALQHVFVSGGRPMPYADASKSSWPDWKKFAQSFPAGAPSEGKYWGYYRLVTVGEKTVLLFKSNVHLDESQAELEELITLLIQEVRPGLILSTGTAGGARLTDAIGTVNVVSAGTLYQTTGAPSTWPKYSNAWSPAWSLVGGGALNGLVFAVPTTVADLQSLVEQFNTSHGTTYTLAQLNPDNLDMGSRLPAINDLTPGGSLLTATTFVVGGTSGEYSSYACIEMDDAVIGKVCNAKNVSFGFVRNISDPVQNSTLPPTIQGDWGSIVYDAYGFYTSYNGALAAWAILSG